MDSDELQGRLKFIKMYAPGVAAIGAIWAFALSPSFRFVKAQEVANICILFGTGLIWVVGAFITFKRRSWALPGVAIVLFAVLRLTTAIGNAAFLEDINDGRCAQIQTYMLHHVANRGDNAELFQALGCRPQNLK